MYHGVKMQQLANSERIMFRPGLENRDYGRGDPLR
jgi:hypothetical protein